MMGDFVFMRSIDSTAPLMGDIVSTTPLMSGFVFRGSNGSTAPLMGDFGIRFPRKQRLHSSSEGLFLSRRGAKVKRGVLDFQAVRIAVALLAINAQPGIARERLAP
jgi:hypothetical protein